eukprot:7305665-Prymnesium_polylepis.1
MFSGILSAAARPQTAAVTAPRNPRGRCFSSRVTLPAGLLAVWKCLVTPPKSNLLHESLWSQHSAR